MEFFLFNPFETLKTYSLVNQYQHMNEYDLRMVLRVNQLDAPTHFYICQQGKHVDQDQLILVAPP